MPEIIKHWGLIGHSAQFFTKQPRWRSVTGALGAPPQYDDKRA